MKTVYFLAALGLCVSCSHEFYKVTDDMENGVSNFQKIPFDSTFVLYVREVFQDTTQGKKIIRVNSKSLMRKKLIEIQYLLVSWQHNQVIYITTIPDRKYKRYSTSPLRKEWVNLGDLYRIHFGIIFDTLMVSQFQFKFKDMENTNTWEFFSAFPGIETLNVHRIVKRNNEWFDDEINVSEALEDHVVFERASKPQIMLIDRSSPSHVCSLIDNNIYFTNDKNKYKIYFRLDKKLNDRWKSTDIYFVDDRVRTSPLPLLQVRESMWFK